MKQILFILISLFSVGVVMGQTDSVGQPNPPAEKKKQVAESARVETRAPVLRDTQAAVVAQPLAIQVDSLKTDSLRKDSIAKAVVPVPVAPVLDTLTYEKYYVSTWLPFQQTPVFDINPERQPKNKDWLFYILTGLVALLASIRLIFPKYFKNLFLLFLQTSIRQKQTREQLLQNNLASGFLNVLFIASVGLYITLLMQYKQWITLPFYQLLFYTQLILFIIYFGKYIFLAFSGWVFNVPDATGSYTFIVFLINKVLGIVLIPFVWLITFSPPPIKQVSITISACIICALFLYRYLISFGVIRSNLKVSPLHFFLYLCAVELLPIVLIYKLLVNFVAGSI